MPLVPGSWEQTGVCSSCGKRAITCGRCVNCGFEPEPTRQEKDDFSGDSGDLSEIPGSIDDILSRY